MVDTSIPYAPPFFSPWPNTLSSFLLSPKQRVNTQQLRLSCCVWPNRLECPFFLDATARSILPPHLLIFACLRVLRIRTSQTKNIKKLQLFDEQIAGRMTRPYVSTTSAQLGSVWHNWLVIDCLTTIITDPLIFPLVSIQHPVWIK